MIHGEHSNTRNATSPTTFSVVPLTARCHAVLERGQHAVVGVSTGNSYFTRRRLAAMFHWASTRFDAVDVIHADLYVEAMFRAFGYDEEQARRRADKETRGVRRRIRGALADTGRLAGKVRTSPLSGFLEDPAYQEVRARVRATLRVDVEARVERDRMAYQFLAKRLGPADFPTAPQVQAALDYIDAELPFFVDSPGILGVDSSATCYHARIPLAGLLYSDREGLRAAENQGYVVVTCPG